MYGLPKRNGKLKDISKFDASFFGVHPKQAHTMDPQLRLLLEVSYEAILDGGKQVNDWKGRIVVYRFCAARVDMHLCDEITNKKAHSREETEELVWGLEKTALFWNLN